MLQYPIIHPPLQSSPTSKLTIPLPVEVELVRLTSSLDLASISLFQIRLNDIISVLPYSPQTSFLHDCRNDRTTEWIISHDQAVQVNLRRQAHFTSNSREDKPALATISQVREL